ncbi:MAG: hypothetical protein EHM13_06420 [Acidobacteria bacterium]|jgi:hypothetical protein|nr:MAG: hypothetical protein EHM13_06420 [Acidobacteriota bacterium]
MTAEEFQAEYARLAHAVQTGVGYEHQYGSQDGTPKHLRTGLACSMADIGSLGRLLIAKGLITEAEYFEAILDGLRLEVAAYELRLTERFGGATAITLA